MVEQNNLSLALSICSLPYDCTKTIEVGQKTFWFVAAQKAY